MPLPPNLGGNLVTTGGRIIYNYVALPLFQEEGACKQVKGILYGKRR